VIGARAYALRLACENVRYISDAAARIDQGSRGLATSVHVLDTGDGVR
jgi:hypothetical protein